MAEYNLQPGEEREDGYNAAREYQEYRERTQRFILGSGEEILDEAKNLRHDNESGVSEPHF